MITANRCGGLKNNAGLFGLLALLLLPSAGCVQLAALAANVTGGDRLPFRHPEQEPNMAAGARHTQAGAG